MTANYLFITNLKVFIIVIPNKGHNAWNAKGKLVNIEYDLELVISEKHINMFQQGMESGHQTLEAST